ncbi:MAG: lactate utilization protein [Planctomycetota bacterium]|jgi:L-lactate utilization protein LutB|nr:lactate utilization protein [Planctomycetota bacterium]
MAASLDTLERNLSKRGYAVSRFASRGDAVSHLVDALSGETVGFGGSVTLDELGLYEALEKKNTVVWHWRGKGEEERGRVAEFTVFLTSANAVAETGEMVNIDGTGNRLACSLYHPRTVYFVIGGNKVAPDLASAVARARNVASPKNAERLGLDLPCAKDLRCHDCASPNRICRSMVIHMRPMSGAAHTEVVLVDEDLGY